VEAESPAANREVHHPRRGIAQGTPGTNQAGQAQRDPHRPGSAAGCGSSDASAGRARQGLPSHGGARVAHRHRERAVSPEEVLLGVPACRLIDGYKCVAALEQLGRDTIEAVLWPAERSGSAGVGSFAALVATRQRFGARLAAGGTRATFGYSLEELARRFDRSVRWVAGRLALVELLPESVQQQVRRGAISAAAQCLLDPRHFAVARSKSAPSMWHQGRAARTRTGKPPRGGQRHPCGGRAARRRGQPRCSPAERRAGLLRGASRWDFAPWAARTIRAGRPASEGLREGNNIDRRSRRMPRQAAPPSHKPYS